MAYMTPRSITIPPSEKPTRVFLVERFDQLAKRIEDTLFDPEHTIGFERAADISAAVEDLNYLDADYVVVNVDEMKSDELEKLSEIRRTYPAYHFFGLSGDPQKKSSDPAARDACEQVFQLTTDLADLKQQIHHQAI